MYNFIIYNVWKYLLINFFDTFRRKNRKKGGRKSRILRKMFLAISREYKRRRRRWRLFLMAYYFIKLSLKSVLDLMVRPSTLSKFTSEVTGFLMTVEYNIHTHKSSSKKNRAFEKFIMTRSVQTSLSKGWQDNEIVN